jgi:putative ubiquitin-RnfH superfamily antitoxin RatB of RatAB toxin-antitoxin module
MVVEVRAPQAMSVTIVFSPESRAVREWTVSVPMGRLVCDVLSMCAVHWGVEVVKLTAMEVGVWGKRVSVDQPLRNGDRLEIYRPLRVDPKVARRERFVRQGAKSAGLFASRRAGGKAGY